MTAALPFAIGLSIITEIPVRNFKLVANIT